MGAQKPHVKIKGTKKGLVFLLDDQCEFSEMIKELQYKLETSHHRILSGPIVNVHVRLGKRKATDEEKEQIRQLIGQRGNLLVQSLKSDNDRLEQADKANVNKIEVARGTIRSGQMIHYTGDLLFLGDVNPGATVTCTGDIYIMGALRGMAHAGVEGNENAIIAASYLRPTQLRIAGVISRPPDEWGIDETFMEFAYLKDGQMEIEKINYLYRIRPDIPIFKTE